MLVNTRLCNPDNSGSRGSSYLKQSGVFLRDRLLFMELLFSTAATVIRPRHVNAQLKAK